MSQLNKGYQSLYEYFIILRDYYNPLASSPAVNTSYVDTPSGQVLRHNALGQQIWGGLKPIEDMEKDVVNTFKPYKTAYHARQDLLQPIRGLGNIVKGVINCTIAPVVFLVSTIKYVLECAFSSASRDKLADNMKLNFARTFSWLLEGVFSVVRGSTQIAATPLTWLKMPLRGVLTAILGSPKIEEATGVQRHVAIVNEAVKTATGSNYCDGYAHASSDYACRELHRKFQRAVSRGQKTDITPAVENTIFNMIVDNTWMEGSKTATVSSYAHLFSRNVAEQQDPSQASASSAVAPTL